MVWPIDKSDPQEDNGSYEEWGIGVVNEVMTSTVPGGNLLSSNPFPRWATTGLQQRYGQ